MKYKYYLRDTTSPRNLEKEALIYDFATAPIIFNGENKKYTVYPCMAKTDTALM